MLMMEYTTIQRNLGSYTRVVRLARKHRKRHPSVEELAEILDISTQDCQELLTTIDNHPDWDNERIAEEIHWTD